MGKSYEKITDIPTDELASRLVQMLILAEGNLNEHHAQLAYVIRDLRGEPHPPEMVEAMERAKEKTIDQIRMEAMANIPAHEVQEK